MTNKFPSIFASKAERIAQRRNNIAIKLILLPAVRINRAIEAPPNAFVFSSSIFHGNEMNMNKLSLLPSCLITMIEAIRKSNFLVKIEGT